MEVNLICNKRRLNPIETRSIPQIELNAATMGARVGCYLGEVLEVKDCKYWSDNICTLYWIRRHARQTDVYVGHRVTEISDLTRPQEWRHCPTDLNPADIPTRGCSAEELKMLNVWWHAPEFLRLPEDKWPDKPITITEEDVAKLSKRIKKSKIELLTEEVLATEDDAVSDLEVTWDGTIWTTRSGRPAILHPDQAWAADEATRVEEAWGHIRWESCSRWQSKVRGLAGVCAWAEDPAGKTLEPKHLADAVTMLIILAQQQGFEQEIKHKKKHGKWPVGSFLASINAQWDLRGRLRAYGRAERQEYLPLETRRPLAIHEQHPVWALLVWHEHKRLGHAFSQAKLGPTLAKKFVVQHGATTIKKILKDCVMCDMMRKQPTSQIMGQLPDLKLENFKIFSMTALDYGGPFDVKVARSIWKAYILIAVCQQSKAINLETCVSLDTDHLLYALTAMASSVGTPEEVTSDNGSQFLKAAKLIAAADDRWSVKNRLDKIDWPKVRAETAKLGIRKWNFSMPYAPQENGLAESMVKLAKEQLAAQLQGRTLPLAAFQACLKRAQMSINDRPLAVVETRGNEQVLTPNHFLFGRYTAPLVAEDDESVLHFVKQYKEVVRVHQNFVEAWKEKCLENMHKRKKWQSFKDNVRVGQVVLVTLDDKKRHDWPLARILKINQDPQGRVRDVVVGIRDPKTNELSEMGRNIRQLVPLALFSQDEA